MGERVVALDGKLGGGAPPPWSRERKRSGARRGN